MLDEDGYANAEYQNLTRKRFVKGWESILDGYKVSCLLNLKSFFEGLLQVGYIFRRKLPDIDWADP